VAYRSSALITARPSRSSGRYEWQPPVPELLTIATGAPSHSSTASNISDSFPPAIHADWRLAGPIGLGVAVIERPPARRRQ